jgi:hypothetical protein
VTVLILAVAAVISSCTAGSLESRYLKLCRRPVLALPRLTCLHLAGLVCLLALGSSAAAECRWLLWGQNESPWRWGLLNVLPGPTHGVPYIHTEYSTLGDCEVSRRKRIDAFFDHWKTPEGKEDIRKFGGRLPFITHYACIPVPLKPERIGATDWK